MTFLSDLLKPVSNITSGIGSGIGSIFGGVGSAIGSFGKAAGGFVGGVGKFLTSPMTLILLLIGGVVVLKFM